MEELQLAPGGARLARPTTANFAIETSAAARLATVRSSGTAPTARGIATTRTSDYTGHRSLLDVNAGCYLHCTKKAPSLPDASKRAEVEPRQPHAKERFGVRRGIAALVFFLVRRTKRPRWSSGAK